MKIKYIIALFLANIAFINAAESSPEITEVSPEEMGVHHIPASTIPPLVIEPTADADDDSTLPGSPATAPSVDFSLPEGNDRDVVAPAPQAAQTFVIPLKKAQQIIDLLIQRNPTNITFTNLKLALETSAFPVDHIYVQENIPHALTLQLIHTNRTTSAPIALTPEESAQFLTAYTTVNSATPQDTEPTNSKIDSDKVNQEEQEKEEKTPYYPYLYDKEKDSDKNSYNPSNPNSSAAPTTNPSSQDDYYPHTPRSFEGYPQPVNSFSTKNHNQIPHGAVGNFLSQQTGFGITKPSVALSTPTTPEKVRVLFTPSDTLVDIPYIKSEENDDIVRIKTVSLTPEPLYHSRLTESKKRLVIAPVEEEPTAVPTLSVNSADEKKPVSFFDSLWNTVTRPLISTVRWFLSFFNRK